MCHPATLTRELITLQLLWGCLSVLKPTIKVYTENPCGQTFKTVCVALLDAVKGCMRSCFGECNLKLALDMLVCSNRVPSYHMLFWPTR